MSKWIKTFVLLIFTGFIVLNTGCLKNTESPVPANTTAPVLTTDTVSAILAISAISGGKIASDGGAPVTQRGVCWGTNPYPLITDQHTSDGTGKGSFISQMTNLISDTLYYVRAYAINSVGITYGNMLSFRTLKVVYYGIKDIDGNLYGILDIGNQKWLNTNLRVTKYRNGDAIPYVSADAQWKIQTMGALCSFDNLAANTTTYGNLYNWMAINDVRGLCPDGWHIPTESDWSILSTFLGGDSIAGGKLKSTGTIEMGSGLWYAPNKDAGNSVNFNALPGGYRINYGNFYSMGNVAYFWSSTDSNSVNAWNYILDANNAELKQNFNLKTNGFSVRCCKD
jgi:uncharacterized protein (TIGR02145 family)